VAQLRLDDLTGIPVQFPPVLAGDPFRVFPKRRLGFKFTGRFKTRERFVAFLGIGMPKTDGCAGRTGSNPVGDAKKSARSVNWNLL